MHDIAVIDFENLLLKEDYNELELSKWREIGDKVYKATSEYGFFYIENHGIEKKYIDEQFDIVKNYFELSNAEKLPYSIQTDNYGYCGLDQEALDETTKPDPKELFNVMTSTGSVPKERIPPYFQENNDKIKEFYHQCHQLSMKILRSFAFGLKLKDYKFFDNSNKIEERSGTTLRYLHYPPIPNVTE
ncbi:Clavaminate synthase-like protein, partial [Conidiobolus coronatus NRRL 28638]